MKRTDKFNDMISSIQCDFSLAKDGTRKLAELDTKKDVYQPIHVLFFIMCYTKITIPVLILASIGLKVLFFPVNTLDKSVDTAYEVVNDTMNGDNAIYNYEWFKEQEAYIRQCLKNEEISKEDWDSFVASLPEDRTQWTRQEEEASLRNSYYALQKLTNKAIEDYNARSSMVNRAIFKDNLPSNISRSYYAGQKLME